MATQLAHVIEKSTRIVPVSFFDEDDQAVTPDTVVWTLQDTLGNIINERDEVEETPASSINILLTAVDNDVNGSARPERVLTIEATYTSVTYGAGLALRSVATYSIIDGEIAKIPAPI